jgi:hypothetical protein
LLIAYTCKNVPVNMTAVLPSKVRRYQFFLAPGGTSHPLVNSSHTHPEARHVPSRGNFLLLLIRWPSFVRLLRKFTNEDI